MLPNYQIPFAGDYVRIVCSLRNAFMPPLVTRLKSNALLPMTLAKSATKLLQMEISSQWSKCRTIWKTMGEYKMPDLSPQSYKPELKGLTNGVYRIRQAKYYSYEHQTYVGK